MTERRPAGSALLPSLAILKSNWDAGGRSYVDYFVPFIVDCLRSTTAAQLSSAEIASTVYERFAIALPEGVIQTALKSAARQGFGKRRQAAFEIDKAAVDKVNLDTERANALRQVNALAERLKRFASDRPGWTFTGDDDAENALRAFVEHQSVPMLRMMVTGAPAQQSLPLGDAAYVVSDFVLDLHARDPEGFAYLETLVKGSMLSGVLYLPSAGDIGRRFDRQTTLYLDTPVILAALGYEGEPKAVAARELLELAYREGATLGCFEHTLAETRGVLNAVGSRMSRRGWRPERAGGVESHFLSLGYNPSDVELLVQRLDADIAARRISVLPKPSYRSELAIDEPALEGLLQEKVGYAHRETLLNDLDSLTAIYRLRGGADQLHLESCRALFITTNPGVVHAARSYFPRREQHSWPAALLDHDVVTLLWLKRPTLAPDLPQKQVIADCYAALEPGTAVWSRYLEEVDRLDKRGEVAEDQFFFLRYSFEAKRALMDLTSGNPDGVSAQIVHQVIERVRTEMAASVREELEAERRRREAAESSTGAALAQQKDSVERLRQVEHALLEARRTVEIAAAKIGDRVHRKVIWVKRGISAVIGFACLVGVWLSLPPSVGGSPEALMPAWRWVARAAVGITVLVTLYGAWFGGSVREAARSMEVHLSRWMEARGLRRAGLSIRLSSNPGGNEADREEG